MSKRRHPGEVVRRSAGSGFCSSSEPELIEVPSGEAYQMEYIKVDGEWQSNPGGEAVHCMLDCGDEDCREWANLRIVSGPHRDEYLFHISECQMSDVNPSDFET